MQNVYMTKHQEALWQALLLFKLFQLMAGVER